MHTSLSDETHDDPFEDFKPLKKKQKRGNENRNNSARQPLEIDGLLDVRAGSIDDGEKVLESDTESYSASDGQSEALAHSTAPVQRLSAFDLSRSAILSETETEWTVRLHTNDVRNWPPPTSYCQV